MAGAALIVRPDGFDGDLGTERVNHAVADDTLGLLAAGRNSTLTYGPDGHRRGEGMRIFFGSFAPRPRMLVFGAIDFAAALARMGTFLGTRSLSVMPGRSSPPGRASRRRTRWWCSGRTSI